MRSLWFLPVLLLLSLAGCAVSEPHPNLGLYRKKLVAWHDSGDYAACFAQQAAPMNAWLDHVIRTRQPGEKVAVVFDIDETLLSNWSFLTNGQFAIILDNFISWTRVHNDPPLPPTQAIFNRARAAGIDIFLITGRPEILRADTIRQLHVAGYSGWTELYLKPAAYTDVSIVPFKSGVRKMLTEKGYRIVLNAGDQWSDLEGGYAERRFKLPNPFYFLP